ncbi:MAG: hypothetical protein ACREXR_23685, partial [Gammaproteobacteria bacterium]
MNKQRLKTGVGNLIVVHRDIRIIDTATAVGCPEGGINRACAFTHSVLRRHSYTSSRSWHRLERVFRLLRCVWNTVNKHHHLRRVWNAVNKHHHLSLGVNRYFTARYIRPDLIIRPMNRTETSPKYLTNIRLQNINNASLLNTQVYSLDASRQDKTDLRVTHLERLVQRV